MTSDPGQELSSINFGSLIGGPLVAVIEAQTQAARATADFIKTVGFDENKKPVYVDFKYPKEVAPYRPGVPPELHVKAPGTGYTAAATIADLPPGVDAKLILGDNGTVAGVSITSGTVPLRPDKVPTVVETGKSGAVLEWKNGSDPVLASYQDMTLSVPLLTLLPIPFIRIEEATIDFKAKINSMETSSELTEEANNTSQESRSRWPWRPARFSASTSFQKKSSDGSSTERTYSLKIHVRATQDEMPAGMEKLLSILEGAMKATPDLPTK